MYNDLYTVCLFVFVPAYNLVVFWYYSLLAFVILDPVWGCMGVIIPITFTPAVCVGISCSPYQAGIMRAREV